MSWTWHSEEEDDKISNIRVHLWNCWDQNWSLNPGEVTSHRFQIIPTVLTEYKVCSDSVVTYLLFVSSPGPGTSRFPAQLISSNIRLINKLGYISTFWIKLSLFQTCLAVYAGSLDYAPSLLRRTASPRDPGTSDPGARVWIKWQRRSVTHAKLWSGLSVTGFPRCWQTCTSLLWPTRTGGLAGTRSPPCSSSSSGTIRSAAASRCSPDYKTVCCSCAASASRTRVSESLR